jgi:NAD(P)-dependent dehydrogenase (short-subunit alcohol dehydrogenase family)
LAGEGAQVALTYKNVPRLNNFLAEIQKAGGQAASRQMDVSDGAAIEATIQEILDQCGPLPSPT